QQRIDAHLEEQRHAEACVAAQREQAGAVDTLESTLSALDHHDDWPSANSLGAMLASQQRRWQEAIGVVAADNKLTQRYDSLNARWQALISHWQNWQTDHTSAWPADLPTPPALRVHTEAATPGAA